MSVPNHTDRNTNLGVLILSLEPWVFDSVIMLANCHCVAAEVILTLLLDSLTEGLELWFHSAVSVLLACLLWLSNSFSWAKTEQEERSDRLFLTIQELIDRQADTNTDQYCVLKRGSQTMGSFNRRIMIHEWRLLTLTKLRHWAMFTEAETHLQ